MEKLRPHIGGALLRALCVRLSLCVCVSLRVCLCVWGGRGGVAGKGSRERVHINPPPHLVAEAQAGRQHVRHSFTL